MSGDLLNPQIQQFYDRSTQIWLDTWGEHMHHGFYGWDGSAQKDHRQAQVDLVEEMLQWAGVSEAKRILDAGCGVGGSARLLAHKFNAEALGFTLSPVQVRAAEELTERVGLSERVRFQARDMMSLGREDGQFDLIWSMESAEHIRDKAQLFRLFYDRCADDGQLLMATWCHRPTPPLLQTQEQELLHRIYRHYHLPPMVSLDTLAQMARQAGFQGVETADWSQAVAPFWKAVIRSALSLKSATGLIRSGWPTIKGAWAMRYMTRGFKTGLLQFGLVKAYK
ncbi:MAG: methyltransferase domain-containing protein [Bacteroidota bacterium]